jgi:tetratricopeptide (TPR) repeat protein
MERYRLRTAIGLIRPFLLGSAVLVSTLALPVGCVSKVDEARVAYADGEGDIEEAERLYRQAMKERGWEEVAKEELFDMFMVEAEKQAKAKKYKRAEEAYRKAVELDPESHDALSGLVKSLMELVRHDEALVVAKDGANIGCRNCRRLMAVLLIRRADLRMEAGDWPAAEQDYVDAYAILPDGALALGIVRARYARKDVQGAAKGLRDAAELIGGTDVQARQQYLELRRAVVLLAMEREEVALADELLDLAPTGVGPEAQLGLAMEVAMALRKLGKPDVALSRMMSLVDAAAQGKLRITEAQLTELRDKVAVLYAARAAQAMTDGDLASAEDDLAKAREINPAEPTLGLQSVLLAAGKGNLAKARAELDRVDARTQGHAQVAAILGAMRVFELIDGGQTKEARAELERARQKAPELPEVHIAMAQLLAVTPVAGLSKSQLADVKKKGLVAYPDGEVTRVAEALSELDWARQQIRGLGSTYPYRAPGTTARIEKLEARLRRFFPYTVKFHKDPVTVLNLENSGSASLNVDIRGADVADSAEIPAGGRVRMTVDRPGFVELTYRGTTAAWVAEPYTDLELKL